MHKSYLKRYWEYFIIAILNYEWRKRWQYNLDKSDKETFGEPYERDTIGN